MLVLLQPQQVLVLRVREMLALLVLQQVVAPNILVVAAAVRERLDLQGYLAQLQDVVVLV